MHLKWITYLVGMALCRKGKLLLKEQMIFSSAKSEVDFGNKIRNKLSYNIYSKAHPGLSKRNSVKKEPQVVLYLWSSGR